MLAFLTNMVPLFSYSSNILLYDSDSEKDAIAVKYTKNIIICDTESINMWI